MPNYDDVLLKDVPLVVLDTETTGLHPWMGQRIVELAAIRYENWEPVAKISVLLDPQRKMEAHASEVTGITDDDLVGKPLFEDVADQFLQLIDGAVMVAHNAPFDAGFVGMELWLAGRYDKTNTDAPIFPNPWIDTLRLARKYYHFGKNNLSNVARSLGVRVGRAHRALNDVEMTAEILKRMTQKELKELKFLTGGDILHAQGGAVLAPRPPTSIMPAPYDTALANKQMVKIQYSGQNGRTTRHITPRYVVQFKNYDYMIAWCHLREDVRAFRLDRMTHPVLITQS